jgi:RNA polymerase sigma-B factor
VLEDPDELFERWRDEQDRGARDRLIERYIPLARKLALGYRGACEPLDDLVQVACLGLVKAVDSFDPDRGKAFTSFAVPTITGELKRYFRDRDWSAHMPRALQDAAAKVQRADSRLASELGRTPTVWVLAKPLDLDGQQVLDALEAAPAHHALSLHARLPNDDDCGETLLDSLGSEDEQFALVDARLTIGEATRCLSERDRAVLALRYGLDWSQQEIAARIGVSQMQVSLILRGAADRISEPAATEP